MKSVYSYRSGNHSEDHVRVHGRLLFNGSNRNVDRYIANMRREAKNVYFSSCFSGSFSDFCESYFSDIFVYFD